MGKSFRTFSTSYTVLPPPGAAPASSYLDALRVEGDVGVPVLDLYLMGGNGLHGGETFCLPGLHVELGAVEGAFDLASLQPAFAQVSELVGADVLEGVELSIHVAQSHRAPFDLILLYFAGGDLAGFRHLV